MPIADAIGYTFPDARGICGFCGGEENGYAKRDDNGKMKAACWSCINKDRILVEQQKRKKVGTIFTEDLDVEK